MTTTNGNALEEAQIRTLMDERAKALRAKDIDGATSNLVPDVLSFDVVNPLQYSGSEAVRKRLEAWFSSFHGPIGFEMRDLSITAGADVAFCRCLNHVSATTVDGGKLDMWWRDTVCFAKMDGHWKITHEHSSVPFDAETGKASLGLKP